MAALTNQALRYVDTHTHVEAIFKKMNVPLANFSEFVKDKFPESFDALVNVACNPADYDTTTDLISAHDAVYGTFGVHPDHAPLWSAEVEAEIVKRLEHSKAVAWGECGLDYYYTEEVDEATQLPVFEAQLRKAVELGYPVVIHTRDAEEDTLRLLREIVPRDHPFHIHCFTGTAEFAHTVCAEFSRAYFGFTGCITFKKAKALRNVVASVPLERCLAETDGPYMAPVPFRGKPCHSGHIPYIIDLLAELHDVDKAAAYAQVRENTRAIYGV